MAAVASKCRGISTGVPARTKREKDPRFVSSVTKRQPSKRSRRGDVAPASPPTYSLKKPRGPPRVVVAVSSEDDEYPEVYRRGAAEAKSRRGQDKFVSAGSAGSRSHSAGSLIVISSSSSSSEEEGERRGREMYSGWHPGHRYSNPYVEMPFERHHHYHYNRGSGQSYRDPIILSSDSDYDHPHFRSRSPFRSPYCRYLSPPLLSRPQPRDHSSPSPHYRSQHHRPVNSTRHLSPPPLPPSPPPPPHYYHGQVSPDRRSPHIMERQEWEIEPHNLRPDYQECDRVPLNQPQVRISHDDQDRMMTSSRLSRPRSISHHRHHSSPKDSKDDACERSRSPLSPLRGSRSSYHSSSVHRSPKTEQWRNHHHRHGSYYSPPPGHLLVRRPLVKQEVPFQTRKPPSLSTKHSPSRHSLPSLQRTEPPSPPHTLRLPSPHTLRLPSPHTPPRTSPRTPQRSPSHIPTLFPPHTPPRTPHTPHRNSPHTLHQSPSHIPPQFSSHTSHPTSPQTPHGTPHKSSPHRPQSSSKSPALSSPQSRGSPSTGRTAPLSLSLNKSTRRKRLFSEEGEMRGGALRVKVERGTVREADSSGRSWERRTQKGSPDSTTLDGRASAALNGKDRDGKTMLIEEVSTMVQEAPTTKPVTTPTNNRNSSKLEKCDNKGLIILCDSTPELSPAKRERKRQRRLSSAVRKLSSQDDSRQIRLDRYLSKSGDRDATPPLEEHKVAHIVTNSPVKCSEQSVGQCSSSQKVVSSSRDTPTRPVVSSNLPVSPQPKSHVKAECSPERLLEPALSLARVVESISPEPALPLARVVESISPEPALPLARVVESSSPEPVERVVESISPEPLPVECVQETPLLNTTGPVTTIPAWSCSELHARGESRSVDVDQLMLGVELGVDIRSRVALHFPPASQSAWNYVVVSMSSARTRGRRGDQKFVESLEEVLGKGNCIPNSHISDILGHVLSVSDPNLLLRLNSLLAIDARSRPGVALSACKIWGLMEECCRKLLPSESCSGDPQSYPQSAHVAMLYLLALLVVDAAADGHSTTPLVQQVLSPVTQWRRVLVIVNLLVKLLVNRTQYSPLSSLPCLLPVLARLLSLCALLSSQETHCDDGAMRLALELSLRMSKLSSTQLKTDLLLLIPCHWLREKVAHIHLQREFPHPVEGQTTVATAATLSSDHVNFDFIASSHLHRSPRCRNGGQNDVAFFLVLIFHLIHSHSSRLLHPPKIYSQSPSAKLSSAQPALSPAELALQLSPVAKEIQLMVERLWGEESLCEELTAPQCWLYLQLLQSMFPCQHTQ